MKMAKAFFETQHEFLGSPRVFFEKEVFKAWLCYYP